MYTDASLDQVTAMAVGSDVVSSITCLLFVELLNIFVLNLFLTELADLVAFLCKKLKKFYLKFKSSTKIFSTCNRFTGK